MYSSHIEIFRKFLIFLAYAISQTQVLCQAPFETTYFTAVAYCPDGFKYISAFCGNSYEVDHQVVAQCGSRSSSYPLHLFEFQTKTECDNFRGNFLNRLNNNLKDDAVARAESECGCNEVVNFLLQSAKDSQTGKFSCTSLVTDALMSTMGGKFCKKPNFFTKALCKVSESIVEKGFVAPLCNVVNRILEDGFKVSSIDTIVDNLINKTSQATCSFFLNQDNKASDQSKPDNQIQGIWRNLMIFIGACSELAIMKFSSFTYLILLIIFNIMLCLDI